MTKNFRLKEARIKSGLTQAELAEKIHSSTSYIGMLESDKGFSYKKAVLLAEALHTTPEWLLFGDKKETDDGDRNNIRTLPIAMRKGVPYYNIDMTASIVESFSDIREEPEFYVDISPLNDCTAVVDIFGDSMFPMFKSGDKVGVKQLFNFNDLQWGEAHLVITNSEANNMKTVKNVHYCKDENYIILRAANLPEYEGDTRVAKKNILSLYIVKGKIQIYQL